VTVVVILLLMTKYILPPLNKALEARQEKIRESLAAADAAKAEAAAAGDERQHLLATARDQAREIVAAAQATSDQVKAEAAGRGQSEYDRLIANANAEVDTARQRAIDEPRRGSAKSSLTWSTRSSDAKWTRVHTRIWSVKPLPPLKRRSGRGPIH